MLNSRCYYVLMTVSNVGCSSAQNNLGSFYEHGSNGLQVDQKKSVQFFLKAANQGVETAQYNLASHYYAGSCGLPQDFQEAARWYRYAADQGYGSAMYAAMRLLLLLFLFFVLNETPRH